MEPIISQLIAPQSFEVVADRIGVILSTELAGQAAMATDEVARALQAEVWKERFIPFDKAEVPAVNITFSHADYSEQSLRQTTGTNTYHIDCYAGAKDSKALRGDQKAKIRLHRLMGVCRAILEDARYKTLAFEHPLIMHRRVTSMAMAQPDADAALASVMGRIVFEVKFPEVTRFIDATPLSNHQTTVKLRETDRGYFYTHNP